MITRHRYNRASLADTMRVALANSRDVPMYVFAVAGGYVIDTRPAPFGQAGYRVHAGQATKIHPTAN